MAAAALMEDDLDLEPDRVMQETSGGSENPPGSSAGAPEADPEPQDRLAALAAADPFSGVAAGGDPGAAGSWLPHESSPQMLDVGYARLREFASQMDAFRPELERVLWPIFVHAYLLLVRRGHAGYAGGFLRRHRADHEPGHALELEHLSRIDSPEALLLGTAPILDQFINFRPQVVLSSFGHQLLSSFLGAAGLVGVAAILRDRIQIKLVATGGKLGGLVAGLGNDDAIAERLRHGHGLRLGVLPELRGLWGQARQQAAAALESGPAASPGSPGFSGSAAGASSAALPASGGSPGSSQEPQWRLLDDPDSLPDPPERQDGPPAGLDPKSRRSALADLAMRARVSSRALPSVVGITLLDGGSARLICAAASPCGHLVAGGFADSSIRVWRVAAAALRRHHSHGQAPSATSSSSFSTSSTASPATTSSPSASPPSVPPPSLPPPGSPGTARDDSLRLLGHAGPVHGLDFSPGPQGGRHLLSCSRDGTVRLWDTDAGRCLVVYRGHNHPVWQVAFGAVGFYFATASL